MTESVQAVIVTIDDEPGIVSFTQGQVRNLTKWLRPLGWYHNGQELGVCRRRASDPNTGTMAARDRRPIHESRRKKLGYVDPTGTFFIFGYSSETGVIASLNDPTAKDLVEYFQRTTEEKLHDAIRAWKADPHASSDFSLAVVVDAWVKENP